MSELFGVGMWSIKNPTIDLQSAKQTAHQALLARARDGVMRLKARRDLGFLQLADRATLWESSESRAKEIRKSAHTLVVLGMGGSSLGGRALISGLKKYNSTHQVEFIDNVDSDGFWKWLKAQPKLDDLHWVIVSKSGNTIETLSMAEFVDQHLRQTGHRRLGNVSTVITELDDNPLLRWARKENVAALEIPKDVGGRYSVLSPVGILPAAFYGLDVARLRDGANWALSQDELIANLVAQTLLSFQREEWITLFWAYSDGLKEFGLWTQQLWAESLGKAVDRKGQKAPRVSTPMAAIGSSDQHSILQQVMEGDHDKFLWFFRVHEAEAAQPVLEKNLFDCQGLMQNRSMGQLFSAMASATRDALSQNGVQSLTLETERLDEASIAALFMLLELSVGAIGEALGINAFDQPGVELGKRLARKILSE